MSGSLIGALRVSLGLDSAQFTTGLKKASTDTAKATNDMKRYFEGIAAFSKGIGALVTAVVGTSLAVAVRESANAMDDLSKAAQKTGTSATELSKLQWAADLSGVAAETLQKALNKLNVAIVDVGPGAKGAAGALMQMGVTARTGTLDAMMKVSDQFARMPDGAQKSALAIKLFGKAGAELIPLLNGGSKGLREAAAEATNLGIVIDGKTARAAEAFNDNLSRMEKVAGGITTQMTAGLVPSLAAFTNEMARSASVGGHWIDLGKGIGNTMLWIGEKAFIVYEAIAGVVNATLSMKAAAQALYNGEGFAAAGKIIGDQERATKAGIKAREEAFKRMRADIASFTPGEVKATATGDFSDLLNSGGKTKKIKAAVDFVSPSDEQGWALKALIDAGTPANIDLNNQSLQGIAATLRDLQQQDFSLEIIRPAAFEEAERFAEGLSQSLGQALVFGQSIGDALVNSFKAAAAEMVTSGLMDILLGSRGPGGQRSGGIIGSLLGIPGFANGTNYAPGGLAMVGERGRELVQLPRGSRVIPNGMTEAMMGGGKSTIEVVPSRLFDVVIDGKIMSAAPAIAQAGAAIAQGSAAQRAQRRFRS
ncbi:MAG: hypothetical protein B7Y35_11240 [Sphingomonadales bacterium 28-64-96]|nr:MAG: hypothetical protein B7Y35_11240 [Sphingomonadales bacterium 28-64-96]